MIKPRFIIISILCGILVVVSVALAFFRYQQNITSEESVTDYQTTEKPEFFLDQSLTTVYRDNGKIDYQFNAEYLEHFKQSNVAEAKTVYFIFYSQDGLTWHASADTATFLSEAQQIRLKGNVRIWQPTRHLELTTDDILFSESREYANTDKAVTIKSPIGTTYSIGMNIDLNQEKLQLFSAVRGLYHVKK